MAGGQPQGHRKLPDRAGPRPGATVCRRCPRPYDQRVIDDVDATLVAFLSDRFGGDATVSVDVPDDSWESARKGAARICCFLHRVREDTAWLSAGWEDVRDQTGRMEGRVAPPRHYRLHYLVSAWAESTAVEHRLLGELLRTVNRFPVVPAEFASGSLEGRPEHIRLWLAAPEPSSGVDVVDVWSSLGVGARLTLELVVGAVLVSEMDTELAPPAETMALDMAKVDGVNGRSAAEGAALAGIGGDPGADAVGDVGRGTGGVGASPTDGKKWTAFRVRERAPGDPPSS